MKYTGLLMNVVLCLLAASPALGQEGNDTLALWREGALYRVEAIDHLLGRRARQALAVVTHLAMLALAAIFAVKGRDFMLAAGETTPFLQIDKVYWYAAIPVCGALMCIYSVAGLWRALNGDIQSREEIVTLG